MKHTFTLYKKQFTQFCLTFVKFAVKSVYFANIEIFKIK